MLWAGIGDTIRVSLAADPVEEIKVGFDILKSLGLRHRGVNIIACPSCARQGFNVIDTVAKLEERLTMAGFPTIDISGIEAAQACLPPLPLRPKAHLPVQMAGSCGADMVGGFLSASRMLPWGAGKHQSHLT